MTFIVFNELLPLTLLFFGVVFYVTSKKYDNKLVSKKLKNRINSIKKTINMKWLMGLFLIILIIAFPYNIMLLPLIVMFLFVGCTYLIRRVLKSFIQKSNLENVEKELPLSKFDRMLVSLPAGKKDSIRLYGIQLINYFAILLTIGGILETTLGGPGGPYIMIIGLMVAPLGALVLPFITFEIIDYCKQRRWFVFCADIWIFHYIVFLLVVVCAWYLIFIA